MRTPIVHFGKGGCACRARRRQAAFLWRSGWLERARQTAPTTPGRVSFVATLRIVSSGICVTEMLRVLRSEQLCVMHVVPWYSAASPPGIGISIGRKFRVAVGRIPDSGDGAFGPTCRTASKSF